MNNLQKACEMALDGEMEKIEQSMTDNEIIKALECDTYTDCRECPHIEEECYKNSQVSAKDILDLINRLQAENEALYKINAKSEDEISDLRKELLKRQNLEESFSKTTKQFDKKLARTVELTRVEAIKEFARDCRQIAFDRLYISIEELNNLEKEKVGE